MYLFNIFVGGDLNAVVTILLQEKTKNQSLAMYIVYTPTYGLVMVGVGVLDINHAGSLTSVLSKTFCFCFRLHYQLQMAITFLFLNI